MKTTAVSEKFVRLNFGKFPIDVLSLQTDWMIDQSNDCSSAPSRQHQFESALDQRRWWLISLFIQITQFWKDTSRHKTLFGQNTTHTNKAL